MRKDGRRSFVRPLENFSPGAMEDICLGRDQLVPSDSPVTESAVGDGVDLEQETTGGVERVGRGGDTDERFEKEDSSLDESSVVEKRSPSFFRTGSESERSSRRKLLLLGQSIRNLIGFGESDGDLSASEKNFGISKMVRKYDDDRDIQERFDHQSGVDDMFGSFRRQCSGLDSDSDSDSDSRADSAGIRKRCRWRVVGVVVGFVIVGGTAAIVSVSLPTNAYGRFREGFHHGLDDKPVDVVEHPSKALQDLLGTISGTELHHPTSPAGRAMEWLLNEDQLHLARGYGSLHQSDDPGQEDRIKQRFALAAFFLATGGGDGAGPTWMGWTWDVSHNWLTAAGECDWAGVHCKRRGHHSVVTKLELSHGRLRGPIPPELRALKDLEYLILDGNLLNGPIPNWLNELASLKELRLEGNLLTGTAPSELCNSVELRIFNTDCKGPTPRVQCSCCTGCSR